MHDRDTLRALAADIDSVLELLGRLAPVLEAYRPAWRHQRSSCSQRRRLRRRASPAQSP